MFLQVGNKQSSGLEMHTNVDQDSNGAVIENDIEISIWLGQSSLVCRRYFNVLITSRISIGSTKITSMVYSDLSIAMKNHFELEASLWENVTAAEVTCYLS